ncbi:MAG TPA: C25 family cysteine peptidase [Blastocatellia bacterium]|nr:C25 family cysteine peptidase [Blastocatellia bacterium]
MCSVLCSLRALTNFGHLLLFVMTTCLNGYFHDPALDSLAESLMKAPKGGAVAVFASSGMTGPAGQAAINREMFGLIFRSSAIEGRPLTFGEATLRARKAVGDIDVRRTYILFGDPTGSLR